MFRKIKKIYFKIYHLLKLLGIFIIVVGTIPIVKADVTTCDDYLISSAQSWSYNVSGYLGNSKFNGTNTYGFPVTQYKTFYVKFFLPDDYSSRLVAIATDVPSSPETTLGNRITTINLQYDVNTHILTIPGSGKTLVRFLINSVQTSKDFVTLVDDTPLVGSHNKSDIENCTLAPNTPPEPEQEGNEVYNNFITMYVEKIKYLAEGFTSNSYLLAMIGIIISWIVLELFLKVLHLKGGYKK